MSPAVQLMVKTIRSRKAGREAEAMRDIIFPFNDLLRDTGCLHGGSKYEAVNEIEAMEKAGILLLERHRRDSSAILKVRIPLASLPAFFDHLGQVSPQAERTSLADLFNDAALLEVPSYSQGWKVFCSRLAHAAQRGFSVSPFDRTETDQTQMLLKALPRLLSWKGESLVRFASSLIFGNSKTLERYRVRLETALSEISEGEIQNLAQLGILENERSFLIHGPLELQFPDGRIDMSLFSAPVRIGTKELNRATFYSSANRCLTVENAAMLYELAKLRSGLLLASSGSEGGFANSAVVSFLKLLPPEIEIQHFGDADPKGFDILRDLRERSGRIISSVHMKYRSSESSDVLTSEDRKVISRLLASPHLTSLEKEELNLMHLSGMKGSFEQESLGVPNLVWPFYRES